MIFNSFSTVNHTDRNLCMQAQRKVVAPSRIFMVLGSSFPPCKQPLRNRLRIAFEFSPFFQVIPSWERLQNKQSWKRSKVCNFFNQIFFIECSSMNLLAKLGIFLRIKVRANSQTRGLEWGWKRKARLGENSWLTRACKTDATLKRFQLVCSLRWE